MCTSPQCDRDSFRILLYRNDATELLVKTTASGFRLPTVAIHRYTRIAEELTASIKKFWNLETYGLLTLPACTTAYAVLETCHREAECPLGMVWTALDSLPTKAFDDPADLLTIRASQETLNQYCRGELAGVFGRPGWLRMVVEWAAAQATAAGLRLTGQFRQLNASPTFSLIRFETNGPALWFKAVGEPNVREHRVTLKLASAFPKFLPRILASRPEWNGWLSLESEGSPLNTDSTAASWGAAAQSLALLQISSFGRRFELIQAGCKDLRPCMLRDLVHPFFDCMTDLMERQTKLSPAPLSRHELSAIRHEVTFALEELEDAGVPSTLGHLDLNPGNVLVSNAHCVFLDWAEAYVGPPMLSFQYLLEQRRRLHGADAASETALVSLYTRRWKRFVSPRQIVTTLRAAPLLAVFAYAAAGLAWRNPGLDWRPEKAGYLRSLVRRLKREADKRRTDNRACQVISIPAPRLEAVTDILPDVSESDRLSIAVQKRR